MSDGLAIVIDDDPSVSNSLRRLFRSVGMAVETYDSAESFLTREPPVRPSCLVLDVRMPGVDGLELQEALKQSNVDIPIVFITGHADVPTSVKALKAGAFDFLEKPFEDRELLDAVRRGIRRDSQPRRERARRENIEARFLTLTPREREVMALVASGLSNKQVAYELGAAEKTIKIHRGRVMQKMQADSLPDLVRMADDLPSSHPPSPQR